jgi:hypothetical protein
MNKITEKELEEILARLEEAGWQPQLCDTPLPAHESVHAGNPTEPGQVPEDDKDVRNLIYDRLHMDGGISDGDLQIEVQKKFGERYPGMSNNDWRHIIGAYTSMVREAVKPVAKEISLSYPMAAEDDC